MNPIYGYQPLINLKGDPPGYSCFIGIDPGKKGAIAAIIGQEVSVWKFTTFFEMNNILEGLNANNIQIAILEKVGAMPKQGVVSMFSFGENFGSWQGLLIAHNIKFELVAPKIWQKEIDKKANPDKKLAAIITAQRLFPNYPIKFNKNNSGIGDAIIMAHYGKKYYGKEIKDFI